MALVELLVVGGILLVGVILWMYDGLFTYSTRKSWLKEFQTSTYKVSEDYVKNVESARGKSRAALRGHTFLNQWEIEKNGVIFEVYPFSTGTSESRQTWFGVRFQMPSKISQQFDLKVQRRGFFSKLLGIYKGEYSALNENFAVYSSNIMLVKHLLNNTKNLRELDEATIYLSTFDLDKICEFKVSRSVSLLTSACDEMLDLIGVFEKFLEQLTSKTRYRIEEIMEDLDFDLVSLECVICYQEVIIETSVILDCCSAIGHEDHITQWVEKKDVCPYCREPEVVLLDPKERF